MKKLLLVLVCLTGILSVSAKSIFWDNGRPSKPVVVGLRAGFDVSNYTGDLGDGKSSNVGFIGGVNLDFGILRSLYINTGVEFAMMGAHFNGWGAKVTDRPWYLRVPVQGSWRVKLGPIVEWQVNAGPYFGFGIGGKQYLKFPNGDKSNTHYFGDDRARVFDFGVGIGTGFTIKKFYVGLGYDFGLTDIYDNVSGSNGNFRMQIGFNFL